MDPWVGEIAWRRESLPTPVFLGLPCGSAGKESACKAGDPGWIPGSGRSPGEGKAYPLQYSWAYLVVQLVKNLPAMQETWIRPLGCWEDPWRRERLPSPVCWPGEFYGLYGPWGYKESDVIGQLTLHFVSFKNVLYSNVFSSLGFSYILLNFFLGI